MTSWPVRGWAKSGGWLPLRSSVGLLPSIQVLAASHTLRNWLFATVRTHDVTMAAELGIAVLDHNIVLEERLAHDAVATVLDISGLSDGFT